MQNPRQRNHGRCPPSRWNLLEVGFQGSQGGHARGGAVSQNSLPGHPGVQARLSSGRSHTGGPLLGSWVFQRAIHWLVPGRWYSAAELPERLWLWTLEEPRQHCRSLQLEELGTGKVHFPGAQCWRDYCKGLVTGATTQERNPFLLQCFSNALQ